MREVPPRESNPGTGLRRPLPYAGVEPATPAFPWNHSTARLNLSARAQFVVMSVVCRTPHFTCERPSPKETGARTRAEREGG